MSGQDAAAAEEDAGAAVASLVDAMARAYGGAEALAESMRLVQRGQVTSTIRDGAEGRLLRIYERPARLLVEIEYPGDEAERRILDGGRGWRSGVPVGGPMYQSMLLQAARLGLPSILLEFRDRLEDLGEVERGGRRLRAVGLSFHRGLSITAEIDPRSGLILRSTGTIRAEGGRPELTFATEYSQFRDVEGVLVPFHEQNFAQGQATGETWMDSVERVDQLPSGTFDPRTPEESGARTRGSRT
jgi:hypothetical protein